MNLILFDPPGLFTRLFPLTLSRPVAQIRVGILTIAEKWEKISGYSVSFRTEAYLRKKFPANIQDDNLLINGSLLPDNFLLESIMALRKNEALFCGEHLLAVRTSHQKPDTKKCRRIPYDAEPYRIKRLSDIFLFNGDQIGKDIRLLKNIRQATGSPDKYSAFYSSENIFLGERLSLKASTLDAESGPVYIGDDVTIQPGAVLCGPCAILNGSVISMGAKIRPNTTVGPHCKIGGEVNNVVFQGYSNKSHDGFLGNSVIGEWCNFGAGTNNSNLKNNYSDIKVWDYAEEKIVATGLMYFGLIMGDHTKCGINSMFNTGTVAGFSANIYDGGYMPKFIPSFAWGNKNGFTTYDLEKAIYTAQKVMERRSVIMSHADSEIFENIFNLTSKHRLY